MDEFERILLEHKDSRFLVVDPIGGIGDTLIYKGMEKKLKEFGIAFDYIQYECDDSCLSRINNLSPISLLPSPLRERMQRKLYSMSRRIIAKKMSTIPNYDVVLLRGGAYLNDIWRNYDALESIVKLNPRSVIVGPHSFLGGKEDLKTQLERINQEIHVFCRERYSCDLLNSFDFPRNVQIHLSPDTALYLSREDFQARRAKESHECSYNLVCTRTDTETIVDWDKEVLSLMNVAAVGNQLKTVPKFVVKDLGTLTDYHAFLDFVRNASKVFTDRLHVAILSAILEKETYLYPNSYHKNRGVYEFSLSKYPNATFIDTTYTIH